MPKLREADTQEPGHDPRWAAFWGIVHEEARRLDALESSRAAPGGKP